VNVYSHKPNLGYFIKCFLKIPKRFFLNTFEQLYSHSVLNFYHEGNFIISFRTVKIKNYKKKNNITKYQISFEVCIICYKIQKNLCLKKYQKEIFNKLSNRSCLI
jgi:predicted PolB exonuclease-like 3'-5' exonuclease